LHAVLLAQVLVHRTVDVSDQDRGRTVVFVAEFVPGWFQRFAMPAPVLFLVPPSSLEYFFSEGVSGGQFLWWWCDVVAFCVDVVSKDVFGRFDKSFEHKRNEKKNALSRI